METEYRRGRPYTADTSMLRSSPQVTILSALGVGAALMYLLDPERGNRRRKLIMDQLTHARRTSSNTLGTTARDLRNRAQGVVASTRSKLMRKRADDAILVGRVRSQLGRLVSHPGAITVDVMNGRAILSGAVLADEVDQLIDGVRAVRGVKAVEDQLRIYQNAENISLLQGGNRDMSNQHELTQKNWTPTTRILISGLGSMLALYGARRRGMLGTLMGLSGAALATRGLTNMSAKRLTGISAGRRAVDVQKTITINAPIERVFSYFTEWEYWPNWMSHVREVRTTGNDGNGLRTHWVVDGPAGIPVEWDAITTKLIPNQELAWKSVEGAAVEHAGIIRFVPTVDGATTVDVKMSYNPPVGAMGHVVAALFGRDPKHQLDDDLARLKTTIETGIPPRDAAAQSSRSRARVESTGETEGTQEMRG
jgi:uncharacterized membrane protein